MVVVVVSDRMIEFNQRAGLLVSRERAEHVVSNDVKVLLLRGRCKGREKYHVGECLCAMDI